ncbi:MAG: tetraacyldisaccharide 4'-kinase [Planctomycetaceae bacterium]
MTPRDYFDLISGRRTGLLAELQRAGLSVASAGYALATMARNLGYDWQVLPVRRAGLPVISIGNLTTGGTGKTPFAAWLARWFRERGVRVCFVSRGYGAGESGPNDEALVLEQLCPDVPHLQNPDRHAAAEVARGELASQLVVLDDGFQHRRLARDLDIVLIDASNPWGYGHWLPRGLLREPTGGLHRADVIVLTRVDQVQREALQRLHQGLRGRYPAAVLAQSAFPPAGVRAWGGELLPMSSLPGGAVAAFCGIGNPEAFEHSLHLAGCRVIAFRPFPDHHRYTRDDVAELGEWVRQVQPTQVLTTQKDLVKLEIGTLGGVPLRAVEIETRLVQGQAALEARLQTILAKVPANDLD